MILVTCALLAALPAVAEDKPPFVAALGVAHVSGSDKDVQGHANPVLVFDGENVPVAAFGVAQDPGKPARYLYFVVFKAAGKVTGHGVGGRVSNRGMAVDEEMTLSLGEKQLTVAYRYDPDARDGTAAKEYLKVGDVEVKAGEPRVFLADLAGAKMTLKPIKAELPEPVPDLKDTEHKTWGPTAVKARDQLREKSETVKAFLDGQPKP
jgi:hypothetical protein